MEEQLRAIEMLIIYGRRTCPNAPMIDGYCVSKCDSSITFSTRAPFLRFAALQFSFPGPQCPSGDFPARVGSGWGAPHENHLSKVVEQARWVYNRSVFEAKREIPVDLALTAEVYIVPYEVIDFLALVLPTGIAIASVVVGIKMARGQSHKLWWMLILAAGVVTSLLTWKSQDHAGKEHRRELTEQKQALQKLLTRLWDIRLDAQFLASKDAVLPKVWTCLPAGNEQTQVSNAEVIDLRHPSRGKSLCPSNVPRPPVKVIVDLCKASETCRAVKAPDLAANFANGTENSVEATDDTATSRLRLAFSCKMPTDVRPGLPTISLSELRKGGLRIGIDAVQSLEFPNSASLKKADLESVVVTLNGIEINLKAKDLEKSLVGSSFVYEYDLKPQDLAAID